MSALDDSASPRLIGRYALHREIAAGGTASVHLGRLIGERGVGRTVAIKRLHAGFASDPNFVQMFLDEGRLAARIRHPNVIGVLDVVSIDDELFLVLDYVQGETLSRLIKAGKNRPLMPSIAVSVMVGALHGLHAAHEATNERGQPMQIVHRDVSPQNILIGIDGIARVTDFGIAKAINRLQTTQKDQLKGKLPYMSPEMLRGQGVDRRADVYAASVVLWEALTGRRLFEGQGPTGTAQAVLEAQVPPPSSLNPQVPAVLDRLVLQGLSRDPDARFSTAREMALALERAVVPAPAALVAQWVERIARPVLEERSRWIAEVESFSVSLAPPSIPVTASGAYRAINPQSVPTAAPSFRTSGTDFQVTIAPKLLKPARPPSALVALIALSVALGFAIVAIGGLKLYRARAHAGERASAGEPITPVAEREVFAPPALSSSVPEVTPAIPASEEARAPAESETAAAARSANPPSKPAASKPAKPTRF